MGMAASQARYLGLTARKTNCEWEGQQINQARTALANQSANYFNQLLGLQVPDCPDKTDYTKTQYSYSDGENASVLSAWRQLSDSSTDYNYVVDHYYYANMYTGSTKLMSDPQVRFKNDINPVEYECTASNMVTYNKDENSYYYSGIKYDDLTNYKYDKEMQNAILDLIHQGLIEPAGEEGWDEISSATISSLRGYHDGTSWHFATVKELEASSQKTLKDGYADLSAYKTKFDAAGYDETTKKLNVDALDDATLKAVQKDLGLSPTVSKLKSGYTDLSMYDLENLSSADRSALATTLAQKGIVTSSYSVDQWIKDNKAAFKDGSQYLNDTSKKLETKETAFEDVEDLTNVKDWLSTNYQKNNDYYKLDKTTGKATPTDIDTAYSVPEFRDMTTTFDPQYVGNQKLEDLGTLSAEDQAALAQIVKDCPDSSLITGGYITLNTDGSIDYSGTGVYKFEWNGVAKYTTYEDLVNSMQTPLYDEKPIEAQFKLSTYEANYIKTEVAETEKALLETDGEGRFKSVKFEDDSTTYVLNCETVTDEDAYSDAMNQYYQKVQEYEKQIADINAKTEVIQQQDRTLELRLKQLDTEQLALQTEMEAVKKVISKNVEMTFKTFSGS